MTEDELLNWLRVAIYTARFSAREALKYWPEGDEIAGQVESVEVGAFIHRNNPRVVLAACDAHTRMLEGHRPRTGEYGPHEGQLICGCSNGEDEFYATPWPCGDVRAVASCYRYEDGYEERWSE